MAEYIKRERIEKFFDGIYDCADLVFEPNDHCCAADDCGHCKWYEAKNAIAKRILSIPAADVVERKTGKWIYPSDIIGFGRCSECKALWDYSLMINKSFKIFPRCGSYNRGDDNV